MFLKRDNEYELRWFTPKGEIDLCGHATLASAFAICTYLNKDVENINFNTKSGILEVSKDNGLFTLSFPSKEGEKCDIPEALIMGLGKIPKEVYKSRDYMAVYETEQME